MATPVIDPNQAATLVEYYSKALLNLLSVVVSGGFVAYVLHSVWTGYNKTKEDLYLKLGSKRDINDCNGYRRDETSARERVDEDLQSHKKENH